MNRVLYLLDRNFNPTPVVCGLPPWSLSYLAQTTHPVFDYLLNYLLSWSYRPQRACLDTPPEMIEWANLYARAYRENLANSYFLMRFHIFFQWALRVRCRIYFGDIALWGGRVCGCRRGSWPYFIPVLHLLSLRFPQKPLLGLIFLSVISLLLFKSIYSGIRLLVGFRGGLPKKKNSLRK